MRSDFGEQARSEREKVRQGSLCCLLELVTFWLQMDCSRKKLHDALVGSRIVDPTSGSWLRSLLGRIES